MEEITGKKVAVLLAKMHDEREFWYPVYRLKEAGAEVTIYGEEAGKAYRGKDGLEAPSERSWKDLQASGLDGVVVPGGFGPDYMRLSRPLLNCVKELFAQGKLVACICHAPWVAASAGILSGKRVTSTPSIKDDLVHAGARWEDSSVVRDSNLITSRKPDDLPDFMKTVLEFLQQK